MGSDTGHPSDTVRLGWCAWLLLALAWFSTVPQRPLFDPDEGRYAEIPREMLVSGDYVTPRLNDLKYFEKPPLQYWATALTYRVAGVHPWSSRLWGVGLAFLCLPLVYGWTRRLYGRSHALAAALALAVSPYFVIVGHLNLLDQAFTFFLAAAVFAFSLAQSAPLGGRSERRWMLAAWAAAALAVLSKGIVVGVLAGGALLLYSLIERDALPWRRLHLLRGVPLILLLAAPWFVLVSLRNPSFPQFFFVHEHFARFLTTVHSRVEPWWFFLPLLLLGVVTWNGALLRALRQGGAQRGSREAAVPAGPFKPLRFLFIFALWTLVFFSFSGSKLAPYILPMFPLLAALTGVAATDPARFARHAARRGAALVLLLGLGLLIYSARRNAYVPSAALHWVLLGGAVALAALLVSAARTRVQPGTSALCVAAAALLAWQCLLSAFALIPPERSARALVADVRPFISPSTPLYSVGQYRETISPYLGRTLSLAGYEGELQFGLSEEPDKRMSLDEFTEQWRRTSGAVAFFEPQLWERYRRAGLPGRVLAADYHTIAVGQP
jgi:4-amino-4-deoxy-L-arabinose transferase-like glycosyltransferase